MAASTTAARVLEKAAKEASDRAEAIRKELAAQQEKFENTVAPLHDELDELEAAIERITGKRAGGRGRRSGGASGARAPRGANKAAILEVVKQRPGVSPAEVAQATGISKPTVYTTLSKMADAGEIKKEDVNGRPGYKAA